jgi:glycosyltransferase involved in cell wall biosynthesis
VNLLLINYEYPPLGGGAANATYYLARAWTQLGCNVTVLTSALGAGCRCEIEDGVAVHRLPVRRTLPDQGSTPQMVRFIVHATARAVPVARRARAHACVAFFTIPSGVVARWLHLRLGLPYLVSLRGGDVPGHVPQLHRMHQVTRPLRRSVLRHAAAIIANSASLADSSRAADPFPVAVVPNGVDCTTFRPFRHEDRPPGAPLRLLCVGRLHPEKNVRTVLQQIAALPTGARACVELTVVGDGAERGELTVLAGQLGIAPQVRWLGWKAKAELPAIYQASDVFVNPSLYEGMPNVVLEAMASGLPIIASDVPGNRSVVQPGVNGLLFRLDQPAELAETLVWLINNPAQVHSFGLAGRQLAEDRYSWTRAARSYLELLGAVRTPRSTRE